MMLSPDEARAQPALEARFSLRLVWLVGWCVEAWHGAGGMGFSPC